MRRAIHHRAFWLASLALVAATTSHAASTDAAKAPCSRVDPGYVLDDSVHGAFGSTSPVNACVDVLRGRDDEPRRLRVFVGGKEVLSSDAVALGPNDGGVDGDPFQPLAIGHGSLIVQNAGGGGPLHWTETWRLTPRNGQWIVAGRDDDATDMHSAADGGGEFHLSINFLTGDIHDNYDPPDDDHASTKHPTRLVCKLPAEWRSPPVTQIAKLRKTSWNCDAKLGKPL
jgi:hypothetical protein